MKSADESQIVWDLLEWGNLEALKMPGARCIGSWSEPVVYSFKAKEPGVVVPRERTNINSAPNSSELVADDLH